MRLAFKVSDSIAEDIEYYSKRFGISKSAFVAVAVGQYIVQLQKQDDISSALKDTLVNATKDAMMQQDYDFTEE